MRSAFFRLVLFIFVHMYLNLPLFNCFDNLVFGRGLETIKKERKKPRKRYLTYVCCIDLVLNSVKYVSIKKNNEKDQSRIRLWNPRLVETKRDAESLDGSRLEGFFKK